MTMGVARLAFAATIFVVVLALFGTAPAPFFIMSVSASPLQTATDSAAPARVDGPTDLSQNRSVTCVGSFKGDTQLAATVPSIYLVLADLNGDKHLDVINGNIENPAVTWNPNEGKQGNISFGPPHVVDGGRDFVLAAAAADLNGDGSVDILTVTASIKWYANDGLGNFSAPKTIPLVTESPTFATIGDIDGDGHNDVIVVAGNQATGAIAWNRNGGVGNFSDPIVIAKALYPAFVSLSDIDQDGNLDVLSGDFNIPGKAFWVRNRGGGKFDAPVILGSQSRVFSVLGADINGDGRKDIVSGSSGDGLIVWYENMGNGTFSPTRHNVANKTGTYQAQLGVKDVNGDGFLDVVSVDVHQSPKWYQNLDGAGTFAAGVNVASSSFSGSFALGLADLDGDGRLDMAVSGDGSKTPATVFKNGFTCQPSGSSRAFVGPLVGSIAGAVGLILIVLVVIKLCSKRTDHPEGKDSTERTSLLHTSSST